MKPCNKIAAPSAFLPPLGTLGRCTQEHILSILSDLAAIYCPLNVPPLAEITFTSPHPPGSKASDALAVPAVDSGYASEVNEDDEDGNEVDEKEDGSEGGLKDIKVLRADAFERSWAQQWITGFVTRAEDCESFSCEDTKMQAIEDAYTLIEALENPLASPEADDQQEEDFDPADDVYRRDFYFDMPDGDTVKVHLNDKLAGTNSEDPDDVGLQSWGASILFSRLLCQDPAAYGIDAKKLGSSPRVVELGAGTGLVSLALGALLAKMGGMDETTLVATDYHPAVLANLAANVKENLADHDSVPIQTCLLDWSAPVWDAPLDEAADILLATDVIYSPEHAVWLRDCATRMLADEGLFWLVVAVRENGKFEGVSETVKKAYADESRPRGGNGRRLGIVREERMEKRRGIGRGDESFYWVYEIRWVE